MFTIKYRTFTPSATQPATPADGPTNYDTNEQLHGPFNFISQEMEDGNIVVYAHKGDEAGMTFGPYKGPDRPDVAGESPPPRPTLWVMNESGATVSKYDL